MRVETVVSLSDIHIPYECPRALGAAMAFIRDERPDHIILNGDIIDGESLSSHGDRPREREFRRELEPVGHFLDALKKASPKAKIHWNEGNHETRLTRYLERIAPALVGMLDVPRLLDLRKRGISWLPYGQVHFIGKLGFTHGTQAGQHFAAAALNAYGCSLVMGHTHRTQVFTRAVAGEAGGDKARGVFGQGCLCPLSAPYLKGPSGWTNGFFYATVEKQTGSFSPHVIVMSDARFWWGRKCYAAAYG